MEFRLLGHLEAVRDGAPVPLQGHKPRVVLALLLLHANQPVPLERLVDALWGDNPPATARQTLQYFVHRLRQALGNGGNGGLVATGGGGYRVEVDGEALDVARFEAALRRARRARAGGDLAAAAAELDQALGLWRGPALADFAADAFAQPHAARLEEQRLLAIEDRADVRLALGRHAEVVHELDELVQAHPFRERSCGQLMVALYRSGRQADALAAFQDLRRRLGGELGIEPGAELRRLEQQILTQDPTLATPVAAPAGAAAPAPEPAQAPAPGGAPEPGGMERRVVTAMVVGLEPLELTGDPEDARANRTRALGAIVPVVGQYGGTILTLLGGTAVAVFGVPRAREDDPERAVRAALAVCRAAAPAGGGIRVGIDTGETVIAPRLGYGGTAAGEVALAGGIAGVMLDRAALLCATAPPGGVLVGDAAWRATHRRIDYDQVGPAWRAVAPRSRTGTAASAPDLDQRGPLVERRQPMELLTSTLARTQREQVSQLVTLIGDPGIGKTRLVAELGRVAERDPELIAWRQGRSVPSGRPEDEGDGGGGQVAFWALAEIVRAHLGIAAGDGVKEVTAKLERAVADLVGDADAAAGVTEPLRLLLLPDAAGVGTAPAIAGGRVADPRAIFTAWTRFLTAVADERLLVLVFEDVHWADPALLDFIDHLTGHAGPVPLMVVCTARPELLTRRPAWGGGKQNAVCVSLAPLSADGSGALLDALLDLESMGPLDAGLRAVLLERAGGNPLFLEEYVHMLRGQPGGTGGLAIPETVQQVITARIDALGRHRPLLQDLAVIGEPGGAGALAAVSGLPDRDVADGLALLERRELVRRTRDAEPGERFGYVFRHPLIREVAYQQLVRAERAAKHRLAAAWIERRGDPPIELLAHHYGQAMALDRADGRPVDRSVAERARLVFRRAGDRALNLGSWVSAVHHYRNALAAWPPGDGERAEVLFRLGLALVYGEHGGEPELQEARAAFAAAGNHVRVGAIDMELGILALIRMDATAGRHFARATATRLELTAETALTHVARALELLTVEERPIEAAAAAREVIEAALERGVAEAEGYARCVLGASQLLLGDLAGEWELRRSVELLSQLQHQLTGNIRWGIAWYLWFAGALDRSAAAMVEGRERTLAAGDTLLAGWYDLGELMFDYANGRWDRAEATMARIAGDGAAAGGFGMPLQRGYALLGRIKLGRGDLDGALADVDRTLAADLRGRRARQAATALRARVVLATGDRERARTIARDLLADLALVPEGSEATTDLAAVLADLGWAPGALPAGLPPTGWHVAARALADGEADRAVALYDALGSPADAADARLRAARRHAAAGNADAARATLDPALALWRTAGATGCLDEATELLGGLARAPG